MGVDIYGKKDKWIGVKPEIDWSEEHSQEARDEFFKLLDEFDRRLAPVFEGNLAALISMLATQALFAMGLLQIKGQEERKPDLELAKYHIDMLQVIEDKTKGNLTNEEEIVLANTLDELRMGYVKVAG